MEDTSWLKQTDEPLFPDLLWSKPENKRQAGKLLIAGGNLHSFAAPAAAYAAAVKAGIGSVKVLLPDSLKSQIGHFQGPALEIEFGGSTPSGSFARTVLAKLLEEAERANGVLLAGDFGHNSETAIVLDSFMDKYEGQVTVAGDALDYFLGSNSRILSRKNTLSVINLGKLQKLVKNNGSSAAVRHSMGLHELVTFLNQWLTADKYLITKHQEQHVVAANGQVSSTKAKEDNNWQVELAAYVSVWLLQNLQKPFEAITTAVCDYLKK